MKISVLGFHVKKQATNHLSYGMVDRPIRGWSGSKHLWCVRLLQRDYMDLYPTRTAPRANPNFHGEKPAAKRLSCGTTNIKWSVVINCNGLMC
jgi:hypothetical protein